MDNVFYDHPVSTEVTEPGHEMCIDDAIHDVIHELLGALKEFPRMNSPHEGWAVIREEDDELWDEIKSKLGTTASRYKEAKQVAAMAIRYMITFGDGERNVR